MMRMRQPRRAADGLFGVALSNSNSNSVGDQTSPETKCASALSNSNSDGCMSQCWLCPELFSRNGAAGALHAATRFFCDLHVAILFAFPSRPPHAHAWEFRRQPAHTVFAHSPPLLKYNTCADRTCNMIL
jgi:hypothetical protein